MMRLLDYTRPVQRLFAGKLRIIFVVSLFLLILFLAVRTIRPTNADQPYVAGSVYESDVDSELFQYAITIDAGSSGSRVYVYVWPPHSGDPKELLSIRMLKNEVGMDVYDKITPGLSSCYKNPSAASDYIKPLLDFAAKNIPKEKHKSTPLFILATAGMRLLPHKVQQEILDDIRIDVPKNYSFMFSQNQVQVISGKEEGIYSWISVNYLMKRYDHFVASNSKTQLTAINLGNGPVTTRPRTIGMLEMGGASVQIAFEITSKYDLEELKQRHEVSSQKDLNDVLSEFNLGCVSHDDEHSYLLYVRTYLGLGANVARETYIKSMVESNEPYSGGHTEVTFNDPCLPKGAVEDINVTLSGKLYYVKLQGLGSYDLCEMKLKEMLNPKLEYKSNCSNECPLKQLQQTKIPFRDSEFYGFSELWYSMEDILHLGGKYNYFKLKKVATQYCSTKWDILSDRLKRNLYPMANYERILHECFKAAWVAVVLHDGFKMPKVYGQYTSALTVNGQQVQWTLGALIFRTRLFPLRAIEQRNSFNYHSFTSPLTFSYYLNYILFILCMLAVLAFIVIYLRHLHVMINENVPSNSSKLTRETHLDDIRLEIPLLCDTKS